MAKSKSTKNFDVTLVTLIHKMSCHGWTLTKFAIQRNVDRYNLTFASNTGEDKIEHTFNLAHRDSLSDLQKVIAGVHSPRA